MTFHIDLNKNESWHKFKEEVAFSQSHTLRLKLVSWCSCCDHPHQCWGSATVCQSNQTITSSQQVVYRLQRPGNMRVSSRLSAVVNFSVGHSLSLKEKERKPLAAKTVTFPSTRLVTGSVSKLRTAYDLSTQVWIFYRILIAVLKYHHT